MDDAIRSRIAAPDQHGCTIWLGAVDAQGYGRYCRDWAHRLVYEATIGPVPSGLQLDHLCRNRLCVNPHHLEPVTNRVNTLRGVGPTALNAKKTHCHKGHPFSGSNLIVLPDGSRRCRACRNERAARYRARDKAASTAPRPLATGPDVEDR